MVADLSASMGFEGAQRKLDVLADFVDSLAWSAWRTGDSFRLRRLRRAQCAPSCCCRRRARAAPAARWRAALRALAPAGRSAHGLLAAHRAPGARSARWCSWCPTSTCRSSSSRTCSTALAAPRGGAGGAVGPAGVRPRRGARAGAGDRPRERPSAPACGGGRRCARAGRRRSASAATRCCSVFRSAAARAAVHRGCVRRRRGDAALSVMSFARGLDAVAWPLRWCAWLRACRAACRRALPQLEARQPIEPRAFGYQVGDVRAAPRHGARARRAACSTQRALPRPGARGRALELRASCTGTLPAARRRRAAAGLPGVPRAAAGAHARDAAVQLALRRAAARAGRCASMPGRSRSRRWCPLEVSPRRGLGELRPDAPPPQHRHRALRTRLMAYAVVALLVLALPRATSTSRLPWWAPRARPFAPRLAALRALAPATARPHWRAACERLHAALERRRPARCCSSTALDRFVARAAALRSRLQRRPAPFFCTGRAASFFGDGALAAADAALADRVLPPLPRRRAGFA